MRYRCPTCRAQHELSERPTQPRELFVRCTTCGFLVEAYANRLGSVQAGGSGERTAFSVSEHTPRAGRGGAVVVLLVLVAVLWGWFASGR